MSELYERILGGLEDSYPGKVFGETIVETLSEYDRSAIVKELAHLKELGLIDAGILISSDGRNKASLGAVKLTAKGRDFIKPDGGISAQLNTVTVRLHAQTIKDLINAKIELSDVDSSTKEKLKEAVRNLPANTLQEVVTHFVQKGLDHGQDAIQWLQKLIP